MPHLPFIDTDEIMSIPLTQGKRTYFNARHLPLIEQHKWCTRKSVYGNMFYAVSRILKPNGKRTTLLMHRLILGAHPGGLGVDHIDNDGLNNIDYNLRLATARQNGGNLQNKHLMSSRYTGVTWNKQRRKWTAGIRVNGKRMYLGYFDVEEDARDAYLAASATLSEVTDVPYAPTVGD